MPDHVRHRARPDYGSRLLPGCNRCSGYGRKGWLYQRYVYRQGSGGHFRKDLYRCGAGEEQRHLHRKTILCWPNGTLGDLRFHGSTVEAGCLAETDTGNEGIPYESPSNKTVHIDGLCDDDGNTINLTYNQALVVDAAGICTFLNFMGGWTAWGNHTACYPKSTDVKDYFIPLSRMFDYVTNTLIKTFWSKLDKPMNRRLIDTILDSANIWLNGLVGAGYLLGASVEMLESENPLTSLMAGKIKLHVYMTPPSPAQEIDFVLEYDADYVTSALQS